MQDFEDLTASDEYDTVIAMRVFDRSHDAFTVLSKVHKALKPGGTLIMYERVYVGMASTISALARRPSTGVHYLRYVGIGGDCCCCGARPWGGGSGVACASHLRG